MSRLLGLQEAADILRNGGLVAIPTETVYGLAADATNEKAVARIFAAKGRPRFNPIITHLPDPEEVFRFGEPSQMALRLAQFWPGPLTMLLRHNGAIPAIVTAGLPRAAFRIPKHELTLELLRLCRIPLAAPSANLSGRRSPTTAKMALSDLGDRIDGVLDGGPCRIGVESTVVELLGDKISILRPGGISREELLQAGFEISAGSLGNPMPDEQIQDKQIAGRHKAGEQIAGEHKAEEDSLQGGYPVAPGQLKRHYAPSIPMLFVDLPDFSPESLARPKFLQALQMAAQALETADAEISSPRICYLAYGDEERPTFANGFCNLSPKGEPLEAAQKLFQLFDQLHRESYDLIVAHTLPPEGLGEAINDRLRRAAAEIVSKDSNRENEAPPNCRLVQKVSLQRKGAARINRLDQSMATRS